MTIITLNIRKFTRTSHIIKTSASLTSRGFTRIRSKLFKNHTIPIQLL